MSKRLILIEHRDDAVAVVTLNRPAKRNALSMALMADLCDAFRQLADNPQCRVVILQGAGTVFCAGLDLVEAADRAQSEQGAAAVARLLTTVQESSLVTVAAVHGAAMAGGAGLMAACDFVVAAENLTIGFPEVRRGLVPALVSTVLRDRLSDGQLRELFLLAEPIGAQRAMEWGMVHRVVPVDVLMEEAVAMARTVLQGAPEAIRQTKRLLRQLHGNGDTIAAALAMHARARNSSEAAEGLAAFAERRPPCW